MKNPLNNLLLFSIANLVMMVGCVPMDGMDNMDTGDGTMDMADDTSMPSDDTGDGMGNTDGNQNTGIPTAQLIEDCTGDFPIEDVDEPATFEVDGVRLIMTGVFMDDTPAEMFQILDANPDVRTIVMANVGGSDVTMDGNLNAGLEIRQRNISTCVPENGLVASGGTDFFMAGANRVILEGGRAGVHSWAAGDPDGGDEVEGSDVPEGDPQHDPFIDFFEALGYSQDFYWFTLDAAPSGGMYYMTDDDLMQFGIIE